MTGMRGSKEMKDIQDSFEGWLSTKYANYVGPEIKRLDTYGRQLAGQPKDYFYSNQEVNDLFKVFLMGYMSGRRTYMIPT